jgi:hypothetical protein
MSPMCLLAEVALTVECSYVAGQSDSLLAMNVFLLS